MSATQAGRALHEGQPLLTAGAPVASARAAMVMVHGRGASAEDILGLRQAFGDVAGWHFVAPQAANGTWYPERFMAPLARNEPWLSSALDAVGRAVASLEAAGVPSDRIVLLGFSQGACLASEWTARHARRFGGLALLAGGLIGPDGTPRDYAGSLDGTPVFLGCGDVDAHIPVSRVRETAEVMERLGGTVDARIYPGIPHGIVQDEVDAVRALMASVVRQAPLP